MTSQKKLDKLQLKRDKKKAKLAAKSHKGQQPSSDQPKSASHAVRYAEFVRGCLYVLSGASLIVALVLGQRGAMVSLDDIIDSLFAAWAGKAILALIGVAMLLYGAKYLRLIK